MADCKADCVSIHIDCCGDGAALAPTIGENGNWYLGEEDTGVRAQGPAGPQGEAGPQGPKGDSGIIEEVYSATPQRIGTWLDGKPLYRRVFTYSGTIPAGDQNNPNTEQVIDVVSAAQIGEVGEVIRLYGVVRNSEGNTVPFPNVRLSAIYIPSAGIRMQSRLLNTAKDVKVVMEYT